MKIVEQTIVGKQSAHTCEDMVVITSDFVAAIDGSTSKTKRRWHPQMSNGRYCARLIARTMTTLAPDCTLDAFCTKVTRVIAKEYESRKTTEEMAIESDNTDNLSSPDLNKGTIPPAERLSASAIVLSRVRREVWMVGDCQCMIDGVLYENNKPQEAALARRRAAVFQTMNDQHTDMTDNGHLIHDYARDCIIPDLIQSMNEQNVKYAVIDGYPIYMPGVRCIPLSPGTHDILLATDGYPFLKETLEASEAALREQIVNDPFNIKDFVATKGIMKGNVSYDDRALVHVIV